MQLTWSLSHLTTQVMTYVSGSWHLALRVNVWVDKCQRRYHAPRQDISLSHTLCDAEPMQWLHWWL